MRRATPSQSSVTTRDRILAAAMQRLARHSYEETGLRDVAADAGVDVSYVHRCFGSKAQLFAEALAAAARPDVMLAGSADSLVETLAKQIFAYDGARASERAGPLDIVVRSLSSPDAARILRAFVMRDFIDPLARKLDQPPGARLALIAAFMAGVGILRNVLGVEPLQEGEGGEIEKLIATTIRDLMTGESAVLQGKSRAPSELE